MRTEFENGEVIKICGIESNFLECTSRIDSGQDFCYCNDSHCGYTRYYKLIEVENDPE